MLERGRQYKTKNNCVFYLLRLIWTLDMKYVIISTFCIFFRLMSIVLRNSLTGRDKISLANTTSVLRPTGMLSTNGSVVEVATNNGRAHQPGRSWLRFFVVFRGGHHECKRTIVVFFSPSFLFSLFCISLLSFLSGGGEYTGGSWWPEVADLEALHDRCRGEYNGWSYKTLN